MKTWFITGGTGGFGKAYAEAALASGDRVVLTARMPEPLRSWAAQYGDRVLLLPLDVTDPQQIQSAVATAEARFGGIDVLVNNAGRGWHASVEEMDDALVRSSFELNFFAVVSVIRAVLPGMRARRSGWIVNMSSVAGLAGVVGFGFYTAAKFALEGLSDSLRQEVAPLGIQVLVVEPGAFRTQAYAGFVDEPVGSVSSDYEPMLSAVHAAMVSQDGKQPGDPVRGAQAVVAAIDSEKPPQQLVLGGAGYDRVVAKIEGMLSEIRSWEDVSRGADFPVF
jgi:NAD(P)-dependent dehydrogenase (short-subunit alcohol dehydrogenase family)